MPGTYQHKIIIDINTDQLNKPPIQLPSEYHDIQKAIEEDIQNTKHKLDTCTDKILPLLAHTSQTYQRSSLASHDSIITGSLSNSINIHQQGNAATIGTDKFYAEYVNDGRGPVKAINKQCLHFITKTGDEVFTKSVGPADPRPYLDDSSTRLDGQIDTVINNILGDIL